MNTYIAEAKRECEIDIVKALKEFEHVNAVEVSAINFVRQAMCDIDGQKIRTWDVNISCKPNGKDETHDDRRTRHSAKTDGEADAGCRGKNTRIIV
jgi:hypothetical protein